MEVYIYIILPSFCRWWLSAVLLEKSEAVRPPRGSPEHLRRRPFLARQSESEEKAADWKTDEDLWCWKTMCTCVVPQACGRRHCPGEGWMKALWTHCSGPQGWSGECPWHFVSSWSPRHRPSPRSHSHHPDILAMLVSLVAGAIYSSFITSGGRLYSQDNHNLDTPPKLHSHMKSWLESKQPHPRRKSFSCLMRPNLNLFCWPRALQPPWEGHLNFEARWW